MSRSHPPADSPGGPTSRPVSTPDVAGEWRDPRDSDPVDAALPQRAIFQRIVEAQGLCIALIARARHDGRWEAHVVSWDRASPSSPSSGEPMHEPPRVWPSVNGPTAVVALDALESELRAIAVIE